MVCLLMAFAFAFNVPLRPRGLVPTRADSASPNAQHIAAIPAPNTEPGMKLAASNTQPIAGFAAPRPCCHGVCHCNMQHPMPGMACCQSACPCSHHPRPSAVLLASTDQPYLLADTIPAATPRGAVVHILSARPGTAPSRAAHPPAPPPESLS